MGKKRKHEKTDEEIRRKIKKLENRLAKRANQSTSDSSEENMISEPLDVPSPGSLYCQSPLRDHQFDEAPRPLSPCPPLSPQEIAPRPDSPRPDEVVEPQPGTSVDNDKQNEELELGEDVLQLLGDAPKTDTSLGPAIHKDVASRWQDILSKGLPKEIKDILYKEYLVPNNCDLLLAPALNPEVKAALPEALIKRDTSLSYRQKQLGVALSALATVTQMVIANTESKRDALLFGENISEKLKAAKSIQQSAAPGGQQTPRQPFRSCAQHSVASTSEQQCTTTPRPDVPAFEDTSSAAEAIIDQVRYAGRLQHYFNNWRNITNDQIILSWVKGYSIPFKSYPFRTDKPSVYPKTEQERQDFDTCLSKLLSINAISHCNHEPGEFLSSIFLVSKPNGDKRFILNLKCLNKFIETKHFKMEDYRTASKLITPNCFMATIDLKDAYFLVPVNKMHRKYLRFEYDGVLYEFNCLPFGLCTAPFVFTKLLKPIFEFLRKTHL
ncbi:uncharacterized protein LOC123695669 [Colias croceus]|uniref:uncharacterized protein LOC123695669 n=1 Tax=Colias crocea TaxID=72248 RepID=UPI001E28096B|nr:uncharacterized protein LOC123695669 [Colias croceus]